MINAFSSMGYPHWLIIAGAVLLVLGFIGLALRQRVEKAELEEMATGDDEGQSESRGRDCPGPGRYSESKACRADKSDMGQ